MTVTADKMRSVTKDTRKKILEHFFPELLEKVEQEIKDAAAQGWFSTRKVITSSPGDILKDALITKLIELDFHIDEVGNTNGGTIEISWKDNPKA